MVWDYATLVYTYSMNTWSRIDFRIFIVANGIGI